MPRLHGRKLRHRGLTCLLVLSILIPLLAIMQPVTSSPLWWDNSWNFRKALVLNHAMVNGTLGNYPVLIDIADMNLQKAQPDGDDFVFVDANNVKLNHEIEFFDVQSGHLVAWVNVPVLSSVDDTTIQLYYGNPGSKNQQNVRGVWDSNYVMVQHLEEVGQASRFDSTGYGNNGTAYGGVSKSSGGKIDGADSFDGVNDYLEVANSASLNPSSALTIELWMNLSVTGNYINLISKGTYSQYYLRLGPSSGRIYWYVKFADGTSKPIEGSSTGWTSNLWQYVVATLDTSAQTTKVYVGGVEKLTGTFASGKSIIGTGNAVRISDSSTTNQMVKGSLDEVRISNVSRSPAWIQTTFNMQSSPAGFCTVGIEEQNPEAQRLQVFNETPVDGAAEVYTRPTLSIQVSELDNKSMKIIFSEKISNNWVNIITYPNAYDGIYTAVPSGMTNLGTTYYWGVSVYNGETWVNKTFTLTTTTKILQQKWLAKTGYRGVSGVLAADIDGDGIDEVIYAGKGGVVALKGTDGTTIWNVSDSSIGDHVQPQMADLDKDGILDIVVPLESPAGILALHANNGSTYWRVTGLGGDTYSGPVVFDIDGNGYPTIFLGSTDVSSGLNGLGRVTALSHDGRVLYQNFAWRPCSGGLSIADTDGDGEFEIYMGERNMYLNSPEYSDNDYGKGVVSFWARNLTLRWYRPEIFCSSQKPMIADVNKDGILDIIIGDLNGGLAVLNATDGSTIRMTLGIPNDAPTHYQPSIYDIDGDGNLEMLMADPHDTASSDLVIWDLVKWKVDARLYIGKNFYGPQVADVTGDGIMEIIACNYKSIFIIDKNYRVIDGIVGLSGDVVQGGQIENIDGISMVSGTLNYAVVQDIDGDGYNEMMVSTQSGTIYAFDTPGRRPDLRPRTEVQFYSEYRLGAAEYVQPQGGPAPVILNPNPQQLAMDVKYTVSQLQFGLIDYQHDLMQYIVTTDPDIGSDSKTNVGNGIYNISITGLTPSTTYVWTVNATDGVHTTIMKYTFTTKSMSDWWDAGWNYRKTVTIDHNQVTSTLTNLPVLIDTTDGDLTKAQQDGSDVAFTDQNNNKLYHEIESYNHTTGHLVSWVSVPLISSTTDTILYLYYGNPKALNQQQPAMVWDSNYVMVQHLEEVGQASRFDSTGYGNNGTAYGGVSKSSGGKIDGADSFDGVNDYLEVANSASLNPSSALTIELWMNLSVTGNYINLISKGDYSQYYLRLGSSSGRIYWGVKFADGTFNSTEGSSTGWTSNSWQYVVATIDTNAQTMKVYINGSEKLSRTFASGKSIIGTGNALRISDLTKMVKGSLDEVRISTVPRSAAWIGTSYNNQKSPSTFSTLGIEETIPESIVVSNPSPPGGSINISPTLSEISFNLTNQWGGLMNYNITTYPDVGSGGGQNVPNGRYAIPITGVKYFTTYKWTVNATDGENVTKSTFTFTTYPSEPPTQNTPTLTINPDGSITCLNQNTSDPDDQIVTNAYQWYANGVSTTNLDMPFETNSSTIVKDYSGYNNNGVVVRGATWTNSGIVGGAYRFDGGFIQVPGTSSLDGGGTWSQITIEEWIYLTADQSDTRTIARIPSYEIGISGNKLFGSVWLDPGRGGLSGYNGITYDNPLQKNIWYHVALTYNSNGTAGSLALYLNGTQVKTVQTSYSTNIQPGGSNPLYIGWFDYFKGKIDEVRVYPKALSQQQIYQRYLETKDGLSNSSTIAKQELNTGSSWLCKITPNDSHQDGVTKSSNAVTIGSNNAPIISSFYPSSNPTINQTEGQTFNITCFDPDGDNLIIRWYVNGALYAGWTGDISVTFYPGNVGIYLMRVSIADASYQTIHEWTLTVLA